MLTVVPIGVGHGHEKLSMSVMSAGSFLTDWIFFNAEVSDGDTIW